MSKCARRECLNTRSSKFSCKDCSRVHYCSIKCRGEDWEELHSFECDNRSNIVLRNLLETPTKLANGKFGEVKQVSHLETGENYALEQIPKSRINQHNMWDSLKEYIPMRKALVHKNIVPLAGHLKDKHNNYLLFSLPPASNLRRLIQSRAFSEDQTRKFFKKLCKAVQILHDQNVPHRNIKTESIYVDSRKNPIICDHTWDPDWLPQSSNNRDWDYMAPEFIEGFPIRTQIDLWSLGIVLFEMTHGLGPFEHLKNKGKKRNIMNLKYEFAEIDYYAKDLITKLLVINPEERLSIEEVFEHPYVTEQEIEVSVGTVFYVNDKQCGILKGIVTTIQLDICIVQYKEINREESMNLKKLRKLLKQSKNLELKQSRKHKKLSRMGSSAAHTNESNNIYKQKSYQEEAPLCIDVEQTKPTGLSIVRNAIAGSKNLQPSYHVYDDDEELPRAPAMHPFYTADHDEEDSEDYKPRAKTSKKPPALNFIPPRDSVSDIPQDSKSSHNASPYHSFYTDSHPDDDFRDSKSRISRHNLPSFKNRNFTGIKNNQEEKAKVRRNKKSDRLFSDYKGERSMSQRPEGEITTENNSGWFKRFFTGS